jgi:predicted dehydrogenase
MHKRIRLGMVGGGQGAFIGAVHRIAARLDDRYELVAGALSSNPERAATSAEEIGINIDRSYADFRKMAAAESKRVDGIEAVTIVTPNHLHAEVSIAFAEVGIDVICDKPMTFSLEEAIEVANVVKKSGVTFTLTHNYTGYPMIREARSLVHNGTLGKIRVIKSRYLQDWLTTDLENQGLKQAEWRTDPSRSGAAGSVGDIGSHAFHLARYITGLELESLAADLTTFVPGRKLDDDASILLRYADGARGSLWCSQVAVGHENDLQIAIYGEKASLQWVQENPNELTFCVHGEPPVKLTRGGSQQSLWAEQATRIPAGHPEGYLEAFAQIYTDAADLILHRRENYPSNNPAPIPNLEDGIAGMKFIRAAVRSSQNGGNWEMLD